MTRWIHRYPKIPITADGTMSAHQNVSPIETTTAPSTTLNTLTLLPHQKAN
jgi:hypothetical protein